MSCAYEGYEGHGHGHSHSHGHHHAGGHHHHHEGHGHHGDYRGHGHEHRHGYAGDGGHGLRVKQGDVLSCGCGDCDVELTVTKACEGDSCGTGCDVAVSCCGEPMRRKAA